MSKHTTHVASNNTPPGGGHPGGTLPFTGFDLGLPVIVAVACVVTGLIARRFSRATRA